MHLSLGCCQVDNFLQRSERDIGFVGRSKQHLGLEPPAAVSQWLWRWAAEVVYSILATVAAFRWGAERKNTCALQPTRDIPCLNTCFPQHLIVFKSDFSYRFSCFHVRPFVIITVRTSEFVLCYIAYKCFIIKTLATCNSRHVMTTSTNGWEKQTLPHRETMWLIVIVLRENKNRVFHLSKILFHFVMAVSALPILTGTHNLVTSPQNGCLF